MSKPDLSFITDETFKTMQQIQALRELQAVQLAEYEVREALILKAATEGLSPEEIERARTIETNQRQELDEATTRRELSGL